MKKKLLSLLLLFVTLYGVISCSNYSQECGEYTPMHILRLDEMIYKYSSMTDSELPLVDSTMSNGISAVMIMLNMGHPDDSAFVKYVNSDAVKIFTPEVANLFTDMSHLEQQMGCIKASLAKELPKVKLCEIYSIVSPYRQSIYIADSTILLALNHYLGKNHEAYNGFDEYVKRTKVPENIPYDIVEALIGAFMPFEVTGNDDLLSRMLYAGVIAKAKLQIIPNASLSQALGYDESELDWIIENEQLLWNALISKELLYSIAHMDIERLLSPSPHTSVLHQDAPGRVGRYFGYRIIESYLKKNPEITLDKLLTPKIYHSQQTLISSGYSGN